MIMNISLCQIPANLTDSAISTDKKIVDIPAAIARNLSCCFSGIMLVDKLSMIKDSTDVPIKYSCHPASSVLYRILLFTGA